MKHWTKLNANEGKAEQDYNFLIINRHLWLPDSYTDIYIYIIYLLYNRVQACRGRWG